jgi:Na+-transporting NADH:ubiquinone oxidoreductase subunit NqrC
VFVLGGNGKQSAFQSLVAEQLVDLSSSELSSAKQNVQKMNLHAAKKDTTTMRLVVADPKKLKTCDRLATSFFSFLDFFKDHTGVSTQ